MKIIVFLAHINLSPAISTPFISKGIHTCAKEKSCGIVVGSRVQVVCELQRII